MEDKAFDLEVEREREKDKTSFNKQRVRKLVEVREMRENEDIDDYFRIFEMTARAQLFPQDEWLGSLVPRLSEKAKSIYLEIVGPDAQNYDKSKATILNAYQLNNVDHYRYRFRHSEKHAGEDFGQWAHRTRRYLNRWMTVANTNNDPDKILEQFVIERLLDGVNPELRVWLKEKKPETAEELGTLANEYVQSRKGPLIDGKYVEAGKRADTVFKRIPANVKQTRDQHINEINPKFKQTRDKSNYKSNVKCFNCQEKGHYAHECRAKKKSQNGACLGWAPLCTTLGSCLDGNLNGEKVQMIIDSGCSRTLVHEKFVNRNYYTGERIMIVTANGERVEVPLAWVTIYTQQARYT
jgi:hypothetical protein